MGYQETQGLLDASTAESVCGILTRGYEVTTCRRNYFQVSEVCAVAASLLGHYPDDFIAILHTRPFWISEGVVSGKIFQELVEEQYIRLDSANDHEDVEHYVANHVCEFDPWIRARLIEDFRQRLNG